MPKSISSLKLWMSINISTCTDHQDVRVEAKGNGKEKRQKVILKHVYIKDFKTTTLVGVGPMFYFSWGKNI